MARINPNTGRIDELRIEKISIVEALLKEGRDFFIDRSMEELAKVQGVPPLKSIRLRNAPVVRLRLVLHLSYERSGISTEAAESG
ncbi:MAG: hypothetical protein WAK33_16895 [Silvibacterium sp.]